MAAEPINVFARLRDLGRVARRLRELECDVAFDGSDDDWTEAMIRCAEGSLAVRYDPEYCAEPNWSLQTKGMQGYFSRFPDTPNKVQALALTSTFTISLSTEFEPEFDPEGDSRLPILFEICRALDGVFFTPSSLRDASGRILFNGEADDEDVDAEWPKVMAEVQINRGAAADADADEEEGEEIDEPETEPRSPERVARRAIALTAVTARAMLENEVAHPKAKQNHERLLEWIEELRVGDELEPDEWEILQRPLGKLDQRRHLNSTWRLEGLVVLAWALDRFAIPPHDQLVEVNPLWRSLGFLDTEAAEDVLTHPHLRPLEELEALRQRQFALHWRLRNFGLNQKVMDFAEFARTAWFGPLDISGLPLVDGDLALGGRRIDLAGEDAFSTAQSAAMERHLAINWLCWGPEEYSEADCST